MTTATPSPILNQKEYESPEEIMARYPRLTAHLICESLGYFSPRAAAMAIRDHKMKMENACEWYIDMMRGGKSLLEIGADTIAQAFRRRRSHEGYMAEYTLARALVERETAGAPGLIFSSWQ